MLKTQLDDIGADLHDNPIESLHPDLDRQETIQTSPLGSTKLLSSPYTSAMTLRFFVLRELVWRALRRMLLAEPGFGCRHPER